MKFIFALMSGTLIATGAILLSLGQPWGGAFIGGGVVVFLASLDYIINEKK